jgi:hypothetical protein
MIPPGSWVPISKAGPQVLVPVIGNFIKERLFADVSWRDNLGIQSRKTATVSALVAWRDWAISCSFT